jgi:hypothetical protein
MFIDKSLEEGQKIAEKFSNPNISSHITEVKRSIGIEETKLAKGVTMTQSGPIWKGLPSLF